MSELNAFAVGVLVGAFVVAWAVNEYRKWSPPPTVEFKFDDSAIDKLTSAMASAWLEQRGLVWMPKGVERMGRKDQA